MLNVGICGYTGKVGSNITSYLEHAEGYRISGKYSSKEKNLGLNILFAKSEVVIDFSSIELLEAILSKAVEFKIPLVIGTTGLKTQHYKALDIAAKDIAIVYSANMTIGGNLLKILSAKISEILKSDYDIEIIESHQRIKKDAPSGTAIEIAKEISKRKGLDFKLDNIYDKRKLREADQIGISSIRGGGILAEHVVLFAGLNEIFEVKHRALNKDCYNFGILKAMHWVLNKGAGLYSMLDVLEIKF